MRAPLATYHLHLPPPTLLPRAARGSCLRVGPHGSTLHFASQCFFSFVSFFVYFHILFIYLFILIIIIFIFLFFFVQYFTYILRLYFPSTATPSLLQQHPLLFLHPPSLTFLSTPCSFSFLPRYRCFHYPPLPLLPPVNLPFLIPPPLSPLPSAHPPHPLSLFHFLNRSGPSDDIRIKHPTWPTARYSASGDR